MMMAAKLCRRISPKTFALSAIALTIILCVYYANYTTDISTTRQTNEKESENASGVEVAPQPQQHHRHHYHHEQKHERTLKKDHYFETCPKLAPTEADVNTVEVFKDFEFQPAWMKSKEYWDKSFEDRYERQKMDAERPPLKVIIIPHSHNDPGWLKTFENYFHYASRQIMNNMVAKLQQYQNLTFIWSEVAFLNAWWEEAHPSKQRALRHLVQSGRLEITTGGWVMTDEANAHVYAMVDQLIEGHQWVWSNLGVKPSSGWSVDPFGHGSTQPYIMAKAGIKGAVIQRIHYAWKQWLAVKQYGDFRWVPAWSPSEPSSTLLTHNQPFDIYSIKHSCGPHPYICLNFDFRKVPGEYTEYSIKAQTITDKNIKEKSELLLEQYARTGSLFPHNVVLMPLGDDFRYNVPEEWDQQYANYIKLIDYINANKDNYKAEVLFGTPKDYFDEIVKRYDQYPTLKGDFFVYSDIFSEGRPAYWSGYFTTRPFMKILDRQLENSLRGAEILYTIALNRARQQKLLPYLKILERDFEKLVRARRNLGLFQHHDAITGTSKSFVMRDYGLKLFEGIRDTVSIQQNALQSLLFSHEPIKPGENLILSDLERDAYDKLAKRTTIGIGPRQIRKIVLYNSLAQRREELIRITTNTSHVKVVDDNGNDIPYQINPIWDNTIENNMKLWISADEYEVMFIAQLAELSATTYSVVYDSASDAKLATIYCNKCHRKTAIVNSAHNNDDDNDGATHADNNNNNKKLKGSQVLKSQFKIKNIPSGHIQLENSKFKLLFNGNTGFMKSITRKHSPKRMQCSIQFGAYRSAQFHSGAYLFMPDPNERDIEKDVLQQYKDQMSIIITSGMISSQIAVVYGPFLTHTVQIYHAENTSSTLADGIYMENVVDFESPPKNRETELFMRIVSDVQNGEPPEFYTDQNGFQLQKRIKVEKIGIEGNYFPITTMAFIQDDNLRLSVLTDHAQGAASWQPGFLELMLDRRTLYDDSRGMGEGLVDNKKTVNKFWLLIEDIAQIKSKEGMVPHPKRFENDAEDNNAFEKGEVLRSFNMPTEGVAMDAAGAAAGGKLQEQQYPLASLYAQHMSNKLNYPVGVFILDGNAGGFDEIAKSLRLISGQFPCDVHLMTLRTQPDPVYSQFPSNSALMVVHRQGYDCGVSGNFSCSSGSSNFTNKFECEFNLVQIKEMQAKTLTGLYDLDNDDVGRLSDVYVEPMTLKTFNMTFV